MSGKSKVVHYAEKDWRHGWWKVTACYHLGPENATDRWADVTCKKCLAKQKENEE